MFKSTAPIVAPSLAVDGALEAAMVMLVVRASMVPMASRVLPELMDSPGYQQVVPVIALSAVPQEQR